MARNIERDILEEKKRRERLIRAGFKLFSERGIENVNLQSVADEAEVGIATLYNYYQNKIGLVSAISARMWSYVWENDEIANGGECIEKNTAYENVEMYLDFIIRLYKEHPEVLKFSGNYKTFITRESVQDAQIREHLETVIPFRELFNRVYETGKNDKTIRTDIPVDHFVTAVALTMLGAAERYAQGIIWTRNSDNNYTSELMILKEMMLNWIKTEKQV